MNCSPPGFSVHEIFQARILEWVAISFSRVFPDSGVESMSPALPADFLLLAILVQMLLLFMVIPRRTEILLHSKISQETNYIKNFQKFGRRDYVTLVYSILSLFTCLFIS